MPSKEADHTTADTRAKTGDAGQASNGRSPRKKGESSADAKPSKDVKKQAQSDKRATTKTQSKQKGAKKAKKSLSAREVVGRIVPVLCLIAAFAGVVGIYRLLFPPAAAGEVQTDAPAAGIAQGDTTSAQDPNAYAGIEDPWYASGTFTTGDEKLDKKVKAFCDGLSTPGSDARTNAQVVFNNIVISTYIDRGEDQKPAGPNWVLACAREFFGDDTIETGVTGMGDYYEFAAATAFTLQYFGYSDAIAVPVQVATGTGETYGSAYCLVTDENGLACLCDPSMGTAGWMMDRYSHDVLVEDIGQDLSTAEAMGLSILRSSNDGDQSVGNETPSDENETTGQSSSTEDNATAEHEDYGYDTPYDEYAAYGEYDEYGYYA